MLDNKRGQAFSLVLGVMTILLCTVVISLFFIQQKNVQSSLVSPRAVLEIRDDLEILELKEIEFIKSSFSSANGEFGSDEFLESFRSDFLNKVAKDESVRNFIFSDLFLKGVEVREQDKNDDLFEDIIYPEDLTFFEGGYLKFGRAKIEKKSSLVAKDLSKIDFPVYFEFEFEREYLISEDGEVSRL